MRRHDESSLFQVWLAVTCVTLILLAVSCSKTLERSDDADAKEKKDQFRVAATSPPSSRPVSPSDASQSVVAYGVAGRLAFDSLVQANEPPDAFNTEEYGRIAENTFLRVTDHPLSTFSIDVDRASYSNVRRYLTGGTLPPRDAVRIEEMINYFTYDYPDPAGAEPFSVTTEIAACPWNHKNRLLLVGLQGRRMETKSLPPNNLVFLIDVSGSMQPANKLPLVKSALGMLVDQLRPDDQVSIVVYAGAAGLVLPPTSGSDKATIMDAIESLESGGSTAGGEGILLAYETAKKNFLPRGNNRVVLATDGDFNVGVTSDGELERLIESKRREGIALTVLGFGMGNIKDSKMELLADKGNGNYAYVDSLMEARKVLVHEMGGTLFTIAKDVKLQLEFNPAKVLAYRLIGYENRMLRAEDFNDDAKDAGEIGAGHSVTALYEVVPPDGDLSLARVDPLKYQTIAVNPEAAKIGELVTVKVRYKDPSSDTSRLIAHAVLDARQEIESASENLRFSASVAEYGMLLRGSELKGSASYDQASRLARNAAGRDTEGYRAEFLALLETARRLSTTKISESR